jgi:PAS domain S-box-containing protein
MLSSELRPDAAADDRLRQVMAASAIGMAIVDLDGRWLVVNPALERMLGYASGGLTGRPWALVGDPGDVSWTSCLSRLINGAEPRLEADHRCRTQDGEVLPIHLNLALVRGPDGEPLHFVAHLRDDSRTDTLQRRVKELERQVDDANVELDRANKQQELLAHGVSHDLRAPLRAIDSFGRILAAEYGQQLDDAGRAYLERIRKASARMGALMDGLLQLSRAAREQLRPEDVDLSMLAEWSIAELRDADPRREAKVRVQHGLRAHGDERQLKQLLGHLLHNAWKFSRGRERVEIDVSGERDGGEIVLAIRDHGAGFDMRYAQKMFEPFQRLHGADEGGGDGLGLAIASRIVERHGGRLWVESEPDGGAVFHVALPATTQSEAQP